MAALVVVMAATQAGCFTAAFDARQDTALRKSGYDKVVLTDQISALALVRHGSGNPQYMFLGKQHSYVVTRGGAELVRIAQSPMGKQVEIFQTSAPGSRLSLSGNDFSGDVVLTAWLRNQDYPPRSVEALGFVPDKRSNKLPQGPIRFTRYRLTVPVAGHLGKPVELADGSHLNHPIAISFWPGGANPVPRRRAAHAGAVALDVITAPVVVLGVLGAVTIIAIGCSLSSSNQPCIE